MRKEKRIIVCGIVCNGNKVLLGRKANGVPPYPDAWHTLGGGIKNISKAKQLLLDNAYNASYFLEELKRELAEEAGIKIKNPINICPKYRKIPREATTANKHGNKTKYIFLEYLCELNLNGGNGHLGSDIVEIQWAEKEELKNIKLTAPSQKMYQ